MPRNEDYLDSLLDSVTEISSKVEQNGARNTGDSFRNEAQFLDEFEEEIARDLENKTSRELVDEFERSLGLLPSDDADNDVDILKNISIETEPKGYQNDSEFSEDISHEELLSDLAGILGGDADTDIEIPIDTSLPKEAPKNENEDIISDVEEVISDIEDEKEAVNENAEEDYSQDLAKNLSSILEKSDETVKNTQSGGVTDNKDTAFEEAVSETQEASPEDSFRQEDDIPDIGSLLDSFNGDSKDTEPLSKEDSLDETASLENGNDAGEENEDKKPSVIGKLLEKIKAIFTPKPEEEESSENEESKLSEEIEGESPKDIKAAKKKAKKEEKERKKAEKEKAKKKAAEERALKKAEKEKNRVPDNSPKIPITVIAAFVILSASIIVFIYILQDSIGHRSAISSAKRYFDSDNYYQAYKELAGLEIKSENKEEIVLYQRSLCLATLEYRLNTYDMYAGKEEIKALDALVRGAYYYLGNMERADELGIQTQFEALGRQIVTRLSDVYGLGEMEVSELMVIEDRKDYTRELYSILERQGLWSLEDDSNN